MDGSVLRGRYVGCLVGAAVGDALGMPNEDVPISKSREYYPGGVTDFTAPHANTHCCALAAGQHTDDTQLMMALAEALVEKGGFDPPCCVKKLIEWYHQENHQKRYRGKTTTTAIEKLIGGLPWADSGVDSTGCGGSTRAIPFGLFYYRDKKKIVEYCSAQCQITHGNQIAKDGAVCVGLTVGSLIGGRIPSVEDLGSSVRSPEFKESLSNLEDALQKERAIGDAIARLGNCSLATEAVSLALFIFLRRPRQFDEPVLLAANALTDSGGDTDSIAFLVGSFSGAYNGIGAIRQDWVAKVENSNRLQETADGLYKVVHGVSD